MNEFNISITPAELIIHRWNKLSAKQQEDVINLCILLDIAVETSITRNKVGLIASPKTLYNFLHCLSANYDISLI